MQQTEGEPNCSVKGITPHCLRHTHACSLHSDNILIKYLSEQLKHNNKTARKSTEQKTEQSVSEAIKNQI